MNSKRLIKITFPFLLLIAIYFVGPSAETPTYNLELPTVPQNPSALETYVADNESRHNLKKDNEARIVWADSTKQITDYAVVYLHGFSASQMEGDPVHKQLAKEFHFNLYLSRLSDHGVDTTESLLLFTADRIWNSAKQALAIGNALGKKVILVSTSTGGTVALKLAAEYPDKVHALINLSPNIAINNPAAFLLNDPWGLQIARMVMGGNYRVTGANEEKSRYWNGKYRLESVVELQQLVETTMTKETFKKIAQPSLTLYYYKSDEEQDPEVKVSAMLEMHEALSTPDDLKVAKAMPKTGAHVIGGALVSQDVEGVYSEMKDFMVNKLNISPSAFTLAKN
jgi:pimeloyl-ACP methyl ester carboxylesterase